MNNNRLSIIHLDLDAFFASVEQRDNPAYRGKPLIVGGISGGGGNMQQLYSFDRTVEHR